MSNRIKSMELMKKLRTFTQLGLLTAAQAQTIVTEYAQCNSYPLRDFIMSPDMPTTYISLLQNISKEFLN